MHGAKAKEVSHYYDSVQKTAVISMMKGCLLSPFTLTLASKKFQKFQINLGLLCKRPFRNHIV